jgi:hypothetical protein
MIMQQKTIRFFSVLLFLFGLSFAAGCQPDPHQEAGPGESSHVTGDVRETTAPHELPSFLRDYPAEVAQTYQEVSKHRDLLAKIPCFCGCGQSVGHRNNLDCFIHQQSNRPNHMGFPCHHLRGLSGDCQRIHTNEKIRNF